MKLCIFGLGYVGTVAAACLALEGHSVVGVEVNSTKRDRIARGKSPLIEPDLDEILSKVVAEGRLSVTDSPLEAVADSELSFICVGTPSKQSGELDLSIVNSVCQEIGEALRNHKGYHLVVIRSTMLPGSVARVVLPALTSSSGKVAGKDFGICYHPEFMREGSAVYDYFNPAKVVIGELDHRSGDLLAQIYPNTSAPLIRTAIEVAEMVKYADNSWHALKICFSNEIGELCRCAGVDSHAVMDIFCQDEKLNISNAYLRPGFAFGGSCLPKDVRALAYHARHNDLDLTLLPGILASNQAQIRRCLQIITDSGKKKVGLLGISFKAQTDDLRESPMIAIAEYLLGKGYELAIYDRNVQLASLLGTNREYIYSRIPHISKLMVASIDEAIQNAELIVIGTHDEQFQTLKEKLRESTELIDFVRMFDADEVNCNYRGISW